jgi:hypothetical protein
MVARSELAGPSVAMIFPCRWRRIEYRSIENLRADEL